MRIKVFAGLKAHFEPVFELSEPAENIENLKEQLIQKNPSAAALLESCRFAVNDDFISDNYILNAGDTIVILPPSSGG